MQEIIKKQKQTIESIGNINLEKEILWGCITGIGAGLIIYGLYKSDLILISTGSVMVGSGILHYTVRF